ncbi:MULTISPECIES: STAS domain-containing protein [unclassified Streptomyces]|uniref:STAS domain-containing protein n=1 Tax=unclassified Streptomyces TaxID=2593676 RepID=UPI0036586820
MQKGPAPGGPFGWRSAQCGARLWACPGSGQARTMTPCDETLGVSVAPLGGRTVVAVVGELDYDTRSELRNALQAVIHSGAHRVDVDVRGLTFCDCAGLSVLLAARADARRVGCVFGLVGPLTSIVGRMFRMVGAAGTLPVRPATRGGASLSVVAPLRTP